MFSGLSILQRFGLCVGTLLVFLVASACVGVVGLNHLFGAANGAVTGDGVLAQRAAAIDILVLNERRFEKDAFINLADPTAMAAYRQKWDHARAQLTQELQALHGLALDETDQRTVAQIEASFADYSNGFEHTFEMIRAGQLKTTQEANAELGKYKVAVHTTEEESERLNQRAMSRMNGVSAMLSTTRGRTAGVQIGITIFCALLAAVLCAVTARSITAPLQHAQRVAEAVATGNFNNQITATGADEIAKVLAALKTMQEALLENELNAKGQLAAIGKALAVAEFNLDGTIRTANRNFLSLFGYELEQIRSRSHDLLLDPCERGEAERGLWSRLRGGSFDSGQYKRITSVGREIFVQASYNPILDLEGKPYKVVLYASDVSEQVHMKRALDEAVRDTQLVVQAAMAGELGARINLQGRSGPIGALGSSVNDLIETKMKLVAQIQAAVRQIDAAAREISAGTVNLSERTCEQSASLEETSSNMEEMASAVKAAANNAQVAQQLSLAARNQASRGAEVLGTAIASMTEINAASARIGAIITVIDEIAFQTNLLALNAAVEAARAGEQGRGFAVVASEVRSLAGRSASAAKEIKLLISDSLDKVKGGSQTVDESGRALGEIDLSVKRVTDVVAEMASVSQEHAGTIEQVNRAVVQMDQVTQQNAALAEEAAAATKSIVQQVAQLEALIARYRVTEEAAVVPLRPAARVPSAPRLALAAS